MGHNLVYSLIKEDGHQSIYKEVCSLEKESPMMVGWPYSIFLVFDHGTYKHEHIIYIT